MITTKGTDDWIIDFENTMQDLTLKNTTEKGILKQTPLLTLIISVYQTYLPAWNEKESIGWRQFYKRCLNREINLL